MLLGSSKEPTLFDTLTNIGKAIEADEFVITLPNGVQIHAAGKPRVDAVTEKGH